jgi:hypothetical protein
MRNSTKIAVLALAATLAAVRPAIGQQTLIGAKAGLVSANVDEDGVDARTGLGLGAFARFGLASTLSLQPEALYVGKGFSGNDGGFESTFKLDYLQVPVLLQVHVPVDGAVSPRLFAGPAIAFKLSCNAAGDDGGTSVEISCADFSDFGLDLDAKSTDFGLVFGAGADIDAGGVVVTLDGRYDLGLTDVLEFQGVSGLKNRAWELFAGVGLPFTP